MADRLTNDITMRASSVVSPPTKRYLLTSPDMAARAVTLIRNHVITAIAGC